MDVERDDDELVRALEKRFEEALEARRTGDVDGAAELLRGILKLEPRLAEPRLELAHLLIETGQVEEAEDHAREAISVLESGGRWTEDLDDSQILSLAWGTLGEALRRRADDDAVVFGPAATYEALVKESQSAFARAIALDPENEHARAWTLPSGPVRRSSALEE
jgi:thioredoxin-like negative regulator of GroEL